MPTEQDTFFESLYRRRFGIMLVFASMQLKDPLWAEEVVQDTFYTALRQPEALLQQERPEAYLMGVLKNKIRESRRARRRYFSRFLSLERDVSVEPKAPANPFPVSVATIMSTVQETLSPEEWDLFQKAILGGATHIEIAKDFGISVWASQKRLERIRKKLEECLPDH